MTAYDWNTAFNNAPDFALGQRLIDAGVPVIVCRPNLNVGKPMPADPARPDAPTRIDQRELLIPTGWSTITAADCDVSTFRPGVDVLAMVGGHGVDVVDVDVKDGGSVENLPPFRSFGLTRTPSNGFHHYVRSTGIGKVSPLRTSAGHVGDFVGGTADGGGRLLAFLPGSTRPKYPGGWYELLEDLDLAALLEHDPDDDLVSALLAHGGTREGQPGKPAVKHGEVQAFYAEHSEIPEDPCRYGRAAIDGLIRDADAVIPGDPTRGRHGWAVRSATRAVELVRAGCATAVDVDALEATLDRVKPEGGTDWGGVLAWALANADGAVGCGLHGLAVDPPPVLHADPDDPDAVVEAQLERAAAFAREVELEAGRLRVREAARVKVAAEVAAAVEIPPFDAGLLAEILARPAEPPHRVEGLIPTEAATLVVAQRKTGKTTLKLNLARSLILGGDFLGRFAVRPITGNVAFLNYEVSAAQLARWADEAGVPRDRLFVVNLRGRRNPLSNDEDRELLSERLRDQQTESLFVDPFGRAFTGRSQNDAGEVGAWLADLDRWARGDVGTKDVILSAHAGWDGERSRGSTALEDWADSVITLTRDEEDVRYFRAMGRDVEVDEDRLHFDGAARSLSLTGTGSRKVASAARDVEHLVPEVVACVKESPQCSQAAIEQQLSGRRETVRKAIAEAEARGLIKREKRGQKWVHLPLAPPRPDSPRASLATLPPRPYRGEGEVRSAGYLTDHESGARVNGKNPDAEDLRCPDCVEPLTQPPGPRCQCTDVHEAEVLS